MTERLEPHNRDDGVLEETQAPPELPLTRIDQVRRWTTKLTDPLRAVAPYAESGGRRFSLEESGVVAIYLLRGKFTL